MRYVLAALVAVFLCLSLPAQAQSCGPYAELKDYLKAKHSEVVVARGVGESGKLMQLFASPDGKSWTLVIVHPTGMACLAADGQDWQSVEAVRGEGA